MFVFFMEKVLPAVLLAVLLALAFIVGGLAASSVAGGAASVLGWGLLVTVLMTAFCAFMGFMVCAMSEYGDQRVGAIVVAALAAIATFAMPARTLMNGASDARLHREWSVKAQAFGQQNFDAIDTDGSGMIVDAELASAVQRLRLTGEERELLIYLRAQQGEAGHVIDSHSSTTLIWIGNGRGGGHFSPVTTTTYVYGITRQDLEGYPQRVQHKWRKW